MKMPIVPEPVLCFHEKPFFSPELLKRSISLGHLGNAEVGWLYTDALAVIDFLIKYDYAILGGDVLKRDSDGDFTYNYCNWGPDPKADEESWPDFVARSANAAREYLGRYPNHESDGLAFILGAVDQKFYDELSKHPHLPPGPYEPRKSDGSLK